MAKPLASVALAALLLASPPVAALEITDVDPEEGTVGALITITGTGFGTGKPPKASLNLPGQPKGLKLKIVESSDTHIVAQLKKGAPGVYDVTLKTKGKPGETETALAAFTLRPPVITSVDPVDPGPGDEVEITGRFFGLKKGKVIVTPQGSSKGKKAKVIEWEAEVAPAPAATQAAAASAATVVALDTSRALVTIPKGLPGGQADITLETKVGSMSIPDVFTLPEPPPKGGGGGSGSSGSCRGKQAFDAGITGPVNGNRTFRANAVFWERPFEGSQIFVQGCYAPVNDLCEQVFIVNGFFNPDFPATLSCANSSVFVSYGEGLMTGPARDYEAGGGSGSCTVNIEVNGGSVEGSLVGTLLPVQTPGGETPEEISVEACFKSNKKLVFE